MPPGRDDKVEAERDGMSFAKITWVVTDKAGDWDCGLSMVQWDLLPLLPAWGPSPGLRLVWDEDESAGKG